MMMNIGLVLKPTCVVLFCVLVTIVADFCSGLMLERLPRHIPRTKPKATHEPAEEEDATQPIDTSVEKRRIVYREPVLRKGKQLLSDDSLWRVNGIF
ncbi:hypothetical protein CEXT_643911 [Caerostris extrusa]|uniref:Secreted protein n=1 Tax=Caerostris extrusa TaxID=172846 RepID=A0AAV4Y7I6_CAEEX|nr:hypothetical protein CEXT_643911 [Caerostris extrusa]